MKASRVLEVEQGPFILLVFTITGGMVACVAWRFWLGALSNKGG